MRLILMRHGIAAKRSASTPREDADRPLTRQGTERTREVVRGLKVLGVAPRLVITSPYARARQTAELVAEGLNIPGMHVVVSEALLPDADPRLLFEALRELEAPEVLCTGHAPHLDRALGLMLGVSRRTVSQLKKAGAVSLELARYTPPRARLVWLLEPVALRRLGKSSRSL